MFTTILLKVTAIRLKDNKKAEDGSKMKNQEIERKFLVNTIPDNLDVYPYHEIEQAYLCVNPVVRIRKSDNNYYLTYKGRGLLEREEYNLPLNQEAYEHLKEKADGRIICKRRYLIPLDLPQFAFGNFNNELEDENNDNSELEAASNDNSTLEATSNHKNETHSLQEAAGLTIELDIFKAPLSHLILAEVEFASLEQANAFIPPDWLGEDVTFNKNYHNSNMCLTEDLSFTGLSND